MIYAQRPDATACADFDIWNNRMNRYVRWTFREKWQRAKASATKKWATNDEAGLQKLPKVKELDAEFSELLTKKKAAYPDYRKARNEMQELVRAQKNVERFFAEEKDTTEKTQTR